MTKTRLNYFERELKNPAGERWNCELCKSEVRNGKSDSPKNNKNAVKSLDRSKKDYTLNDVMEKLFIMDERQCELMEKYDQQVKINNELRLEIDTLKTQLANEVNKNEQKQLENNIIIKGIPQIGANENLNKILCSVYKALKIDIPGAKCFRVGTTKNKTSAETSLIKVCFKTREDKQRFMQAKKQTSLTVSSLGLGSNRDDIFINHDLTKRNQYLHMLARKYKKDNNYKYVWVSDGNILLKKDDNSKIRRVQDENDLKNS